MAYAPVARETVAPVSTSPAEPVLKRRRAGHVVRDRPRRDPPGRRHQLRARARAHPGDRRRVGLGQERDRALDHAARCPRTTARIERGRIVFEGRDLLTLSHARAALVPRQPRGDDLPGADDRAQPGADRGRAGRRGVPPAPRRLAQAGLAAGGGDAGEGAHPRPGRARHATTRTSSRAACASA